MKKPSLLDKGLKATSGASFDTKGMAARKVERILSFYKEQNRYMMWGGSTLYVSNEEESEEIAKGIERIKNV